MKKLFTFFLFLGILPTFAQVSPTRTEVENFIDANIIDNNVVVPGRTTGKNHRRVEKKILDYVDANVGAILPDWDSEQTYYPRQKVVWNGFIWQANDTTVTTPGLGADGWTPLCYQDLSDYLTAADLPEALQTQYNDFASKFIRGLWTQAGGKMQYEVYLREDQLKAFGDSLWGSGGGGGGTTTYPLSVVPNGGLEFETGANFDGSVARRLKVDTLYTIATQRYLRDYVINAIFPEYSDTTTYELGNRVVFNNQLWVKTTLTVAGVPPGDGDWTPLILKLGEVGTLVSVPNSKVGLELRKHSGTGSTETEQGKFIVSAGGPFSSSTRFYWQALGAGFDLLHSGEGNSLDYGLRFRQSEGLTIKSGFGSPGAVYEQDYSGSYTNRSLIDKGYADATYQPIGGSGGTTIADGNTSSDVPVWTGSEYAPRQLSYGDLDGAPPTGNLFDLGDVLISSPLSNQFLKYDAGIWRNAAIPSTTHVDTLGGAHYSNYLTKAGNLAGLASPSTARTNLGLGSLATQSGTFSGSSSGTNTGDQDLSGLLAKSNNLSDLPNAATARTNLGLGSLATQSGTFSGVSSGTNTGDETTTRINSLYGFSITDPALKVSKQDFLSLTYGSTTTWDNGNYQFPLGKVTATGSFTLAMTNVKSGATGTLKLTTNTASAITIAFDAGFTHKTQNTSFTTYTLPAGTGKDYFLTYLADGTTLEWVIVDGTGAVTGLPSGTAGQVLVYNASNVGTATTISGDVAVNSSGVATIGNNKVTVGQLAQSASNTVLANLSGSTANVAATATQDVLPASTQQTSLNTESGWSGDTKTVSGLTAPGIWSGTNLTSGVKYIYTCTVDGTAIRVPSGQATDISAVAVVSPYSTKSGNYTLTASDHWVEFTATANATLPSAASVTGQEFVITNNAASGTITIVGTLNGSTSNSLTTQYKTITIKSNGTEYRIISQN